MGRKRAATCLKKPAKKRLVDEVKTETTPGNAKITKLPDLWDADHSEDGQKLVSDNKKYHDLLISNSSTLSKELKATDTLWTLLLQRGVVDEQTKDKIQSRKTEQAQVLLLVSQLTDVEVYKLHGFIWALVNSHQHHIAELLGFDVPVYFDMKVFMKYSNFRCPACSEFYTKAYILTGCGHYICAPCVKGAKFIYKSATREDLTCPVPECQKITEASPSEGSLGLDEDIPFKDLCQALAKEMTVSHCSDCNTLMSASPVKHYCSDCDKVLCAGCTTKHKKGKGSHHVLHHHLTDLCCLHGKNTEAFCAQCDIFFCDQCKNRSCRHEREDVKKDKGPTKHIPGILKGHIGKLNSDVSCLNNHSDTLGKHEAGVKEYINSEVQKVRQVADAWAQENLVRYSRMQEEVGKSLNQSLQWKKAVPELTVLLMTRPWLLDVGHIEILLKDNTEIISSQADFIKRLSSGCPIPRALTPVPLILTPPNKGGAIEEMTCPFTVENISKLGSRQFSPPFFIRNLAWKIGVELTPAKGGRKKSLGFHVSVKSKPGPIPKTFTTELELRLLNWKPDKWPYSTKYTTVLSCGSDTGLPDFFSWNKLMDPDNGYVKNDYIRLEAHIKAEEPKE